MSTTQGGAGGRGDKKAKGASKVLERKWTVVAKVKGGGVSWVPLFTSMPISSESRNRRRSDLTRW
jgi:hypothetical protein